MSEKEFKHLDSVEFYPSEGTLTDCSKVSMPSKRKQYRNYIVARYESIRECDEISIDYHSEEIIVRELDYLWKGYMKFRRGVPPKCFILYSWNFPCTDCTEAIISALKRPPYKGISTIVAFSQHWRGETERNVYHSRIEMRKRGIYFTKVNGVALESDSDESDSDDSSKSESDGSEIICVDTNEPDDYKFDSDDHSDSNSPYSLNDDSDWGDFTDSDDVDSDLGDLQDCDDNLGGHSNSYDVTNNSDDDSSDQNDVSDLDNSELDDNSSVYDMNDIILGHLCFLALQNFYSQADARDSYDNYEDEEYYDYNSY